MKPIENVIYWRDPELEGIEICQVGGSRHVFPDLAQTALTVGFSDQSHFTNTFRKYTGATPGQYLSESSP